MYVFLQRFIYPRTASASFYVTMVGATPYKLFLRVPWVNKQLASSDFTFRKRQKVACVKYDEKWSWENILVPFLQPIIENRGGDGFLGAGLAKNKFCTDMLGLLSPKTTPNLFWGLMNVSCSHSFAPWDVVRLWWRSSSW
jgi:hypothetical protein